MALRAIGCGDVVANHGSKFAVGPQLVDRKGLIHGWLLMVRNSWPHCPSVFQLKLGISVALLAGLGTGTMVCTSVEVGGVSFNLYGHWWWISACTSEGWPLGVHPVCRVADGREGTAVVILGPVHRLRWLFRATITCSMADLDRLTCLVRTCRRINQLFAGLAGSTRRWSGCGGPTTILLSKELQPGMTLLQQLPAAALCGWCWLHAWTADDWCSRQDLGTVQSMPRHQPTCPKVVVLPATRNVGGPSTWRRPPRAQAMASM